MSPHILSRIRTFGPEKTRKIFVVRVGLRKPLVGPRTRRPGFDAFESGMGPLGSGDGLLRSDRCPASGLFGPDMTVPSPHRSSQA